MYYVRKRTIQSSIVHHKVSMAKYSFNGKENYNEGNLRPFDGKSRQIFTKKIRDEWNSIDLKVRENAILSEYWIVFGCPHHTKINRNQT